MAEWKTRGGGADPLWVLLFPLTVCVLNLQSDGASVTDTNPHLASCCELLELVLRKGLQRRYPEDMCFSFKLCENCTRCMF